MRNKNLGCANNNCRQVIKRKMSLQRKKAWKKTKEREKRKMALKYFCSRLHYTIDPSKWGNGEYMGMTNKCDKLH